MPFFPTPSAGGVPVNLDNAYEMLGFGDGSGTGVQANVTQGVLGSLTPIGTASSALAGLILLVGIASSSSARVMIDLSIDGFVTTFAPSLYLQPGTNGATEVYLPLNVPAGAQISAKLRAAGSGVTVRIAIIGIVRNANSPPCFTSMVALSADTSANVRPSTIDVPLAGSIAWTPIIPNTAAAYGALMISVGDNGTTAGSSQQLTAALAVGPAGGGLEVEVSRHLVFLSTASPQMLRGMGLPVFKSIPAGQRISGAALAFVPGAGPDKIRIGVYGFVP